MQRSADNRIISEISGFLLTSHWYEAESGTRLEFWFATESGPVQVLQDQASVCFIARQDVERARTLCRGEQLKVDFRQVGLRSFEQTPVSACYLAQQDIYRFQQLLADWDIKVWEYDLRPTDRYLMERFIRGGASIRANPQQQPGYLSCSQAELKRSHVQPKLKVLSVDIETSYPKKDHRDRLFSIAYQGRFPDGREIKRVLMIGSVDDQATDTEFVADEISLLQTFLQHMQQLDPDILIGWNFIQFDMQFLQRKCEELDIEFALGRGNGVVKWRQDKNKANRHYVYVPGRAIIDGIEMLRQAEYHFESFALDNVAHQLLGRNKLLTGDEMAGKGRANEIEHLFEHNKAELAAYNLEDCQLVSDIFELTEMMDFAIERSQLTGLLIDRMGGSVAGFENLYLPLLHRDGYVAPNYGDGFDGIKSPGGFVMDSRPGLYDSVLVLDFKSLYPSIIRTFKIDPMGLVDGLLSPHNAIAGFNGGKFDRHKHQLPELINQLWAERDKAKREDNPHLSQAIKIIMSSFYGVLGSTGCRFFDVRLSSSITQRGHEIIQRSSEWIEQQGYDVIYGDTDSVFVWLKEKKSQQQADDIGQDLSHRLNLWWTETINNEHQIDSGLEIEYETHYQRFFMPSIRGEETGSKKRYAGLIEDKKSAQKSLVFKGLEAVRTDWTHLARDFQQELFDRLLLQLQQPEQVALWIKQQIELLLSGQLDEKLIYRKRLRQPLADYQKNTPPHAKAAMLLEYWRERNQMPALYEYSGGWIEYVMTTSGPQPVEITTAPLDYHHYLEKQMAPVADGLLAHIGTDFAQLSGQQLDLF